MYKYPRTYHLPWLSSGTNIALIKQLNNELLKEDIPYIKKYKREQKLKKIIYEK